MTKSDLGNEKRERPTYLVLEGEVLELLLLLFLQKLQLAQLLLPEIMLIVEPLVLLITVDHLENTQLVN